MLKLEQNTLGKENPDVLITVDHIVFLYESEQKYHQAQTTANYLLPLERKIFGEQHPRTLATMNDLGYLSLKRHSYSRAEMLLRTALKAYQKRKYNAWDRYYCESMLGHSLAEQKRYAEAEPFLLVSHEGLLQHRNVMPFWRRGAIMDSFESIIMMYTNWGRPEKANEWREKLKAVATTAHAR